MQRSASYLALLDVSPHLLPNTGQDYLADLIGRHIDFSKLRTLIAPDSPRLMVGAVEVLSGRFAVFRSHHSRPKKRIGLAAVLASAAIPELFRAVQIGDGVYWDGLFCKTRRCAVFCPACRNPRRSRMKSGSSGSARTRVRPSRLA